MNDSFEVITRTVVKSCGKCPFVHNDAWDHDDSFTACPSSYWRCKDGDFPINYLPDGNTKFFINDGIHPKCKRLNK